MASRWRTGAFRVQAVVVEACWRPMTGDVAGDFHDVIDLRDGRVAVVVGDAVGYGPKAAEIADMLQSRARTAFGRRSDPAGVLDELDAALAATGDEKFATATCAIVDPDAGVVLLACAGHLPPVFVESATVELFDGAPDPPLGVRAERRELERPFHADTTMFLYTDGLIERRGESLGDAMDTLVRTCAGLTGAGAWASEAARRATDLFGVPTDDATVVSVRLDPGAAGSGPFGAGPRRVALRVFVDPRDLRSPRLVENVRGLATGRRGIEVHVEVIDVTEHSTRTEDAGVLAAPTIIRDLPEPPMRVIGWYDTTEQLARALQLPTTEDRGVAAAET